MQPLFLAFGGNLDSPQTKISEAITILSEKLRCAPKVSSFYETKAMTIDGKPGPTYINCVAKFESTLPPDELLKICLEVERDLGRVREQENRWASRKIDIDILSYGDVNISSTHLSIPHPGIALRDFVLIPLAEIESNWTHPVTNKTVKTLIEELATERYILRKMPC